MSEFPILDISCLKSRYHPPYLSIGLVINSFFLAIKLLILRGFQEPPLKSTFLLIKAIYKQIHLNDSNISGIKSTIPLKRSLLRRALDLGLNSGQESHITSWYSCEVISLYRNVTSLSFLVCLKKHSMILCMILGKSKSLLNDSK